MNSTDKSGFAAHILAIAEIYGKALSTPAIGIYWTALQGYPLAEVQRAIEYHVHDPAAGRYFPKPADLIRHLQPRPEDDGHPGADEAWGLLVRLIQDERETGVLTDEMRAGWQACQPILELGDEVGARRCFLTVYARHVEDARQRNRPARWTVTLGTDPALRQQRLGEALEARRIRADLVHALLPGPAPASLDQVAGLLEGPDAGEQEAKTAERLRALAALLRAGSADAEARRERERQQQREREAERKRAIQDLLDGRGDDAAQAPHDRPGPPRRHAGPATARGSLPDAARRVLPLQASGHHPRIHDPGWPTDQKLSLPGTRRRGAHALDHRQRGVNTMPVTTIENENEFRHLDAAYDRWQRGAREEFAAWREAHPDFTSKELLDNWKRIRCAWHLGVPEPKPRKKTP